MYKHLLCGFTQVIKTMRLENGSQNQTWGINMNKEAFRILREFKAPKNMTQRHIANVCNISLGKINKIINSLKNDGFIKGEDNNYTLTKKSHNLLEQHRVDNAIIMAAGFGSRFLPLSYEIPKGLLEVFDERMIERQIKQLLNASITDIVIVVGHLKEKFKYLIDKYGVKLIYSPDYATKNNLSTLYHVRYLLKNTYILSSDNYMTKNLFNTYEFESWYSAIKSNDYTEEWCLVTDKKDRIKKVEIGGYNKWHMYGPVYFSKSFSEMIVPLIEYAYHQPGSDNFYWEDVLVNNLDKLEMYVNQQPENTVYEFENLEELREFDPTYKERSNSKIMSVIASIFKVKEDKIKNIKPLKLGMTNKSFSFEINKKKYICRIPGEGTEKLINRDEEYRCYEAVSPLNITDNVVYMDTKSGIKISEYEKGSRVVDINNPNELKNCMNILRKLHCSDIVVSHSFNIEKNIFFYEELCRSSGVILFEDYSLMRTRIGELTSILKSMKIPSVFSHIDANCDNFLVLSNGDIKLIDWEYAGMSDPVIDISMFAIYSYFNHMQLEELIGYYFEDGPTYEERLRIYIYVALGGFLWAIWAQYKQSLGRSFGDYTLKMYCYAKDYYKWSIELIKGSDENYTSKIC